MTMNNDKAAAAGEKLRWMDFLDNLHVIRP